MYCCFLPFFGLGVYQFFLQDYISYGLNQSTKNVDNNKKPAAQVQAKRNLFAYLPTISINRGVGDNLKVRQSIVPAGSFVANGTKAAFTKKLNTTGTLHPVPTVYDQSLITGLEVNKRNDQQPGIRINNGMAWLIINGLKSSMVLMLFVVPAIYPSMENRFDKVQKEATTCANRCISLTYLERPFSLRLS